MSIDRVVPAVAGAMVLFGLILSQLVSDYFLLLAAFAGFNMLQSAFIGFCPLAMVLRRLGLRSGAAF
jgi:hypothetical protein